MLALPIRTFAFLGLGGLGHSGSLGRPAGLTAAGSRPPTSQTQSSETAAIPEQYILDLLRAYASAGFAAVVTINSGALVAGLSQASHIDFVHPAFIACALFIWAFGVTTGVATWGAAYRAIVALAASDPQEQMRWRGVAAGLFHVSLSMFLLGFGVVGVGLAA
ncbi:hypothetical protein [Pararhodobacter sp. SW119]|uniref:hypothetical protein n=1 Tax=Pararhodobacter sp. SW119 TaxID=2780075 RepID=UPI001ADF4966|nr:hypothetical protein [Pararhodobacter sp. SW119]